MTPHGGCPSELPSVLFIFPGSGALALVWLIAVYAILFGATLIGLALRLRRHRGPPRARPAA